MRSEWQLRRVDELGTVGRGRSRHRPRNDPALYGGEHPFVQTGDVKAAGFRIRRAEQSYNDVGLSQSKKWPSGTLCITIAANIGDTAILGFEACFPDSVVGFLPHKGVADTAFVKYSIDTLKLQMQNVSRGTTQDNLSLDKFLKFRILTPPLPTQRRIASILSAYDDLIENNTKRIEILEEMARSLYREWFVHFRFPGHEKVKLVDSELGKIPEGWSVLPLGKVARVNQASIKRGKEPAVINYVDIKAVSTDSIEEYRPMAFADAPGRARRAIREGDVIWSTVRPNRRSYARVHNPPACPVASTGFAVLSPGVLRTSFIYCATTTDEFVNHLVNHARGAAYPAVTGKDFEAALLVIPAEVVRSRFDEMVEPMFLLSGKLHSKNSVLRQTRDLLLPKLISGEIDVDALDVPEAS